MIMRSGKIQGVLKKIIMTKSDSIKINFVIVLFRVFFVEVHAEYNKKPIVMGLIKVNTLLIIPSEYELLTMRMLNKAMMIQAGNIQMNNVKIDNNIPPFLYPIQPISCVLLAPGNN